MEAKDIERLQVRQQTWLMIFSTLCEIEENGFRAATKRAMEEINRIDDILGPEQSLSGRINKQLKEIMIEKIL